MTKGPETMAFFIDTNANASADPVEEKKEEEEAGDVGESVLGAKESEVKQKLRERAATEKKLASFLFGNPSSNASKEIKCDESDSESSSDEESEDLEDEEDAMVEIDSDVDNNADQERTTNDDAEEDESEEESEKAELPADVFGSALHLKKGSRKRKAAWKDEDDSDILVKDVTANYSKAIGKHGAKETSIEQYGKSLTRKFRSVVGEPGWADLDKEDEGDSDDEFFRETTDLLDRRKKGNLQQGSIEYRKLKDMNNETHKEGAVIRSTEFHPKSTVGLVAGLAGTASLFQIDGKNNPKIQTVNFQDFPIKTAKFSTSGEEFIVGSQHHGHFYSYDMMAGKIVKIPWHTKSREHTTQRFEVGPDGKLLAIVGRFGNIHLVSARSKEYIGALKMNDECNSIAFNKTGDMLYSHGTGGEVYVWDVRSSLCVSKFTDDGCLSGSALSLSSTHLAAGSNSGVVNIYSLNSLDKASPKPDKIVLNLTTQINSLQFHPSGEVLAMGSEMKEAAVKLVHFPSMTVFANFPGGFNLQRANSLAWSPGGGYLSIGNNKGAANLYRIKHYGSY